MSEVQEGPPEVPPEDKEPGDPIEPFVGRAKELPESTRRLVIALMEAAVTVEADSNVRRMEPCPVCGTKIDARLVSVEPRGKKRELLPGQIRHLVLAHDFWHPSMEVLLPSPEGETVTRRPKVRAREEADLPFSEFSDFDFDQLSLELDPVRPEPRSRPEPREAPQEETVAPVRSRRAPGRAPPRRPELPDLYRGSDPEVEQICSAYQLPASFASGLASVARAVGAKPSDLANLVSFESGFDPSAVGPSGVGATGLVQFTPSTARSLGTTTQELRAMSFLEQLPYVRRYLDRVRDGRPLDTPHRLYMAVFYPAYLDRGPLEPFPEEVVRKNTFRTRSGQIVSIRTPADYAALVERQAKIEPSTPVSSGGTGDGILDQIFSFFSNLFGPPNGTSEPGPQVDPSTSARWDAPPGLDAVLVDASGQEWRTGQIPAGTYRLVVPGRPAAASVVKAGRVYRASSLGRLFEVVDG